VFGIPAFYRNSSRFTGWEVAYVGSWARKLLLSQSYGLVRKNLALEFTT